MAVSTIFASKYRGDTIQLDFDWLSFLGPSETLVSAVVTIRVAVGTDPDVNSMLSGSASIDGKNVFQTVTGGVPGVIYLVSCAVTTNLSADKIMRGQLAVISDIGGGGGAA